MKYLLLVIAFLLCLIFFGCDKQSSARYPLEVVRQGIKEFQTTYPERGKLSVEEFVAVANQWQEKLVDQLELQDSPRLLNVNAVIDLLSNAQSDNLLILMRHGEQQKSLFVENLASKAEQKIFMMRKEDNMSNPLTPISMVEAFGMAVTVEYVSQLSGKSFTVETSSNLRALQVAELIGVALSQDSKKEAKWNCIDYPSEKQLSTSQLLEILPNGSLPWNPKAVDLVVGRGSFAKIERDILETMESSSNHCVIAITHTQQISAAAVLKGLPSKRLHNYGFILIPKTQSMPPSIFENGVYE